MREADRLVRCEGKDAAASGSVVLRAGAGNRGGGGGARPGHRGVRQAVRGAGGRGACGQDGLRRAGSARGRRARGVARRGPGRPAAVLPGRRGVPGCGASLRVGRREADRAGLPVLERRGRLAPGSTGVGPHGPHLRRDVVGHGGPGRPVHAGGDLGVGTGPPLVGLPAGPALFRLPGRRGGERGDRLARVRAARLAGPHDAPGGNADRGRHVGRVAPAGEARRPSRGLRAGRRRRPPGHPRGAVRVPIDRHDLLLQPGGGSTLIAIAMHGLHNDSVGLMGRITGGGYAPYVVSELALLVPILAVVLGVLAVSGRKLGLGPPSATKW